MEYIQGMVSVVIPTHNRAQLLARAVDSALAQTYQNIEIIVVSDGSEDDTEKVMKKTEAEHSKLHFISYFPGRGGNYARNTGIKAAKGEWVAFLDDDDEWHADKIEKQINAAAEDSECGLICTAINWVDDATGKSTVFVPEAKKDSSRDILLRNCIGSTTTVMAKHHLLDECGMFDEDLKARQDFDLWIRLCQITKVAVVKTPCVEYHNLATNGQISWNYEKYSTAIEYMSRKYQSLREERLEPAEIKDLHSREQLGLARKAMKSGKNKIVRKLAIKSIKIKFNGKALIYYAASFFPIKTVARVRNFLKIT